MISKITISISLLLLTHSCYSAHEHSTTSTSTPLDIILETLFATLLLCLGIILSNKSNIASTSGGAEDDGLRPIALRVWAGKSERERGCGPFNVLEERLGFLNIRARREEFAVWAKEVGGR